MKKLLLTTMVLGSTVAVAACSGTSSEDGLDGGQTNAPYTEERTIGTTGSTVGTVAVTPTTSVATGSPTTLRSAEPVFQSRQVK